MRFARDGARAGLKSCTDDIDVVMCALWHLGGVMWSERYRERRWVHERWHVAGVSGSGRPRGREAQTIISGRDHGTVIDVRGGG